MLQPKKTKFKKAQKGKVIGTALRGTTIKFGHYALIALEPARLSAASIESTRVTLNRKIKKYGKMWIRVFPNVPVTKKPTEVRMGQGKGPVDHWIARIKTNRIILEISDTIPQPIALLALKAASHKLPFLTKIIISGNTPKTAACH